MKIGRNLFILLVAACNVTVSVFPGFAEDEAETDLILPDSYFIERECDSLRKKASEIYSLKKTYQTIDELCKNYGSGKISGDEWLKEIAPIEQRIREAGSIQIARNSRERNLDQQTQEIQAADSNPISTSDRNVDQSNVPSRAEAETTPNSGSVQESVQSSMETSQIETSAPVTFDFPDASGNNSVQPNISSSNSATESASAIIVSNPNPIPQNYSAYTLFLFPSQEWIDKTKQEELKSLRQIFKNFGQAIGEKKAAIWFSLANGSGVDIDRSKYYCDQFKLNYNDGPYVVVTQKRPDASKSDEIIIVKLANIATPKVVSILNVLEQDLRTNQKIHQRRLLFEEIKQSLLTTTEKFNLQGIVFSWLSKN